MNEESVSSEGPATASGQPRSNPPRRILVVDDDNDFRQLSVDLLVGSGYHVEAVKDGSAAWDALQVNRYDLVVTDNKMPKMTGVEMIEKLRSAGIKVPVVMATGSLPIHEFASKPWLYPDATLQRPFPNYAFVVTVKKVLHRYDSYNARRQMLLPGNP